MPGAEGLTPASRTGTMNSMNVEELLGKCAKDLDSAQVSKALGRYPGLAKAIAGDAPSVDEETLRTLIQHRSSEVRALAVAREETSAQMVRDLLAGEKSGTVMAAAFAKLRGELNSADVEALVGKGTQATWSFLVSNVSCWQDVADAELVHSILTELLAVSEASPRWARANADSLAAFGRWAASVEGAVRASELFDDAGSYGLMSAFEAHTSPWRGSPLILRAVLYSEIVKGGVVLSEQDWAAMLEGAAACGALEPFEDFLARAVRSGVAVPLEVIERFPQLSIEMQDVIEYARSVNADPLSALGYSFTASNIVRACTEGLSVRECLDAYSRGPLDSVTILTDHFPGSETLIAQWLGQVVSQGSHLTSSVPGALDALMGKCGESLEVYQAALAGSCGAAYWGAARMLDWACERPAWVMHAPVPLLREAANPHVLSWLLDNTSESELGHVDAMWESWSGSVEELVETVRSIHV